MKWIIDGETYENTSAAAEYLSEQMDSDNYDDMLDDAYGDIDICGIRYAASIALFRVDGIAYNCGFNDYKDSLSRDIEYELERMDNGDTLDYFNCEVQAVEDEEKTEG